MLKNTLADATSPYLLQHADNPVAWQAWGEPALQCAIDQDLPVLLSIGYAACHWCHVMAHESFADPQTAALMNRLFVNIKIDREERPDLDRVYQLAHQIIAGQGGGWPLTVFIDPRTQAPFFSGTYFPVRARYGLPAFGDLLVQVADYYRHHRSEIAGQRQELLTLLNPVAPEASAVPLDGAVLDMARHQLAHAFDRQHGGFGGAPKFPQPGHIERLLRHWHQGRLQGGGDAESLQMAESTLLAMAEGGVYDQLAGGFFRYAVDDRWEIPHFEKMLYDNGQLLALYAQAWSITGRPLFRQVVEETVDWMVAELRHESGAFYSSLDADSEGGEGSYYVWSREQVEDRLDTADAGLFCRAYGLDRAANFEGRWHLRRWLDVGRLAAEMQRPVADIEASLARSRESLRALRRQRPAPACDDKLLAGWNALAIRGLAIAARHTASARFLALAREALAAVRGQLYRDGRLRVSWRRGQAPQAAFLDDHVYLIDALLELLQLDWRVDDLRLARELAEQVMSRFRDPQQGGFFLTADDHETLIHRPRAVVDDAMPSAYGVATRVFGRLAVLYPDGPYGEVAEQALTAVAREVSETPYAHHSLLSALEERLRPPEWLVIRAAAEQLPAWRMAALQDYAPQRLVFAIATDGPDDDGALPPALAGYPRPEGGRACAYYCYDGRCQPPLHTVADMTAALSARFPETA